MIALISPAKTMSSEPTMAATLSTPRFMEHTSYIVELMMRYSVEELCEIFVISHSIAEELKIRFGHFFDEGSAPIAAIDSYSGVVYKHFKEGLTPSQIEYLNGRVRISSLLYGLLRPLDAITPYRMEGNIRLAGTDMRVDRYWRDIQTSTLISDVEASGGVLLYLASKQEQSAFNWREVQRSVRVIDIQFLQYKGSKLRQVVIYTKMARGEMLRYMAENMVDNPEALKDFEWGGYRFSEDHSTEGTWVWIME